MTTVFENVAAGAAGTHVFAIGVGAYPFLIDGVGGALAKNPLGLSQLSSPPVSAKAFIDWCLAPTLLPSATGFTNRACPLASVEALVSSMVPTVVAGTAGPIEVDPATRTNIDDAFDRWIARVASNDANIGVFYFCGHGVMVADHYLLAEDFGRSADRPWDRAFDVSNTLRAVEREVKGSLFFFVDACREVSRDIASTLGGIPSALKAVELRKPVVRASASLIQATGEGKLAFALEGKVSRFTEALITSLSGFCGVKGPGSLTWDVDGELVAFAVRKLLESGNKTTSRRQLSDQTISGAAVPLISLATSPKVKVRLDLLPEDKRKVARLYLLSAKGSNYEQLDATSAFQIEVPRGFYDIGAKPSAAEFVELLFADEDLIPPLYDLTMKVQ